MTMTLLHAKSLVLKLCLLPLIAAFLSSSTEAVDTNCTEVPKSVEKTYLGWPYTLNCNKILQHYKHSSSIENTINDEQDDEQDFNDIHYDYSYSTKDEVQGDCIIIDQDKRTVLVNSSFNLSSFGSIPKYKIHNMQLNSSVNFKMILKIPQNGICLYERIYINLTRLKEETCERASLLQKHHEIQATVGRSISLFCEPVESNHKKLFMPKITGFSVRWFRNCTEVSEKSSYRKHFASSFNIAKATWQHPGIYTCAVTHNGQTLYMIHHRVCFEPEVSYGQSMIKCAADVVYTTLGQKAVLKCTGTFGEGKADPLTTNVYWEKISAGNRSKIRCVNQKLIYESSHKSQNSNINCEYEVEKIPCYLYTPREEDGQARSQKISIKLTIENVKTSDLGIYSVMLSSWTGGLKMANTSVTLKPNAVRSLVQITTWLIVSLGIICVFMAIGVYLLVRKCKLNTKKKHGIEETATDTESI